MWLSLHLQGGRKGPSGYIVFAGEIRKEIQAANPDMSFGEISKVVGFKVRTSSQISMGLQYNAETNSWKI